MSVELTIETVEETIVLELQDHVPAVLTIDHIPELRDELDSRVDKVEGYSLVADDEIGKLSTVEEYATANRPDAQNADKIHEHVIADVAGLADALADKVDKEVGMGLSELSFTAVDKLSLEQSEQDRHTHSNKTVIDDLSDDSGVLQYKGLPISDHAALDAKVDKVAGYSLVDDAEITKLVTVQENATANRDDSENADKVHEHVIADVAELAAKLELINQWLQVPADKKYFDFVGNRYSENGAPAPLSSLGSTFTRLSAATQWKDGVLVDVAANVMRIDVGKGLLIEPQRTNYCRRTTELPSNISGSAVPNGIFVSFNENSVAVFSYFVPPLDGSPDIVGSFQVLSDTPPVPFSENPMVYPTREYYLSLYGTASGRYSPTEDVGRWLIHTVERKALNQIDVLGVTRSVYDIKVSNLTFMYPQAEVGIIPTSYIPSPSTSPTTRTKETLVIPFAVGQTVTADKDAGVTMTIVGNNAVFEGHGYIRTIEVN